MKIIIKESAKNRLFLESIKMEAERKKSAASFRKALKNALENGNYDFDGSKITIYSDNEIYTYELGKNYVDHNGEATPLHYSQKSIENLIGKYGLNQEEEFELNPFSY